MKQLGRYVIEDVLGKGAMGTVYRATDTTLRRAVALKVLEEGAALPPKEAIARFLREGRAAASLIHPNVVRVFDVGEADGRVYLAMELVEGKTMRARMAHGSPSFATRVRWLVDLARGLSAAHAAQLVHRDVKPENVLIDEEGTAKLTDFGIVKHAAEGPASFRTRTGNLIGTPEYMAPEQWTTANVDARADQYSWAVIANELLGRGVPSARVPGAVKACIEKAAAKKPEERHASMDDVVALLEPWCAEIESVTIEEPAPRTAPKRSLPVFVFALAATVVILSLAAVVFFVRKKETSTPELPVTATPLVTSAPEPPAPSTAPAPEPRAEGPVVDATAPRALATTTRPPLERVGDPRVETAIDEFGCLDATTPMASKMEAEMAARVLFTSDRLVPCFRSRLAQNDHKMNAIVRLTLKISGNSASQIAVNSEKSAAAQCISDIVRHSNLSRLRQCRGDALAVVAFRFKCSCVRTAVQRSPDGGGLDGYCLRAVCD